MTEKNEPNLRFKEFSGEWKKNKLKEIANINPKVRPLPEEFVYVDLESVQAGRLINENIIYKEGAPSRAIRTLDYNDILFQMVRPYQKNNYIFKREELNFVASTGYAQIRTNKCPDFLYQHLHLDAFNKKVILRCTGTSYPAINSTDLGDIYVSIPSLPEQQKIANYLTALDDKITLLAEKETELLRYKKAMMQKLFAQEIRFKPSTCHAEPVEAYPDWEEKKLGEVAEIKTGSTPSTIIKQYYNGNYLFVSPFDISGDKYIIKTKTTLTQLGFRKCRIISGGSICFVCIGSTIGKIAIVKEDFATNQQINSISAFDDFSNEYLYYYLESVSGAIKLLAATQAVPLINKTDFSKTLIKYPSLPEQQKIADFLSALDEKINQVKQQVTATQSFKKAMLQQMFV